MNEYLILLRDNQYIPAAVVACLGWWCVHWLNSTRDRVNAERGMRNTELAKVYSVLLRIGLDGVLAKVDSAGNVSWSNKELEDAIGKIYLYGTKHQVELTKIYVESWASTNGANSTELLDDIRDHIRRSLGLPRVLGTPTYLRIKTGA